MNRILFSLIVLGMLLFSAACNPGAPFPQAANADPATIDVDNGDSQLLYEGKGPLEITPAPDGSDKVPGLPGDQGAGNIESQSGGGRIEGYGGEPGQIDSTAPEELTSEDAPAPLNWLTFFDEVFNFSIAYPDTYTILPETAQLQEVEPGFIHRVRFQDVNLAASDNSDLELPQFTIEVFDLDNNSLQDFIKPAAQGSKVDEYTQGDLRGFRIYSSTLIAPNEYYFFTDDVHAYKLTPLGQFSLEMLNSFFLQP
jgi:hypothetical protein